jgi:hypothetical protein
VEEQRLPCLCYAVDHWQGDEHAGQYGEEVFDEVNQYNDRNYRQFSYLLRRSFDDAIAQFEDESIDLLHIDGLHTYEAVTHDFRLWLPKVNKGGIILLHDICPRHQDFGVWRLWNEIKEEFPDTFEFHHSWGLGVVRNHGEAQSSPLTEVLFESSPAVREEVRRHYIVYASHLETVLGPEVHEKSVVAGQLATMQTEINRVTAAIDAAQRDVQEKGKMLQRAEDQLYRMQHSLSWRVTAPVRRVMTALRSGRPRKTK